MDYVISTTAKDVTPYLWDLIKNCFDQYVTNIQNRRQGFEGTKIKTIVY